MYTQIDQEYEQGMMFRAGTSDSVVSLMAPQGLFKLHDNIVSLHFDFYLIYLRDPV